MGATAVELDRVSKRYRLGEHHGRGMDLRDSFGRLVRRIRGEPGEPARDFWSLRDVSFTVDEGQAVGIIGRNGAGKSTLLKIVSNITAPTEGRCRTRGRVGSLLEVGTGFHGELTGLENTYLNGAILGMSRREVASRLDEIVAFAGLERFMDTPVKRYSSGMFLRLGFAVAAHMNAEILVVDEVLAVGDAEFQHRCLGKMREVEQSGRTVLFVSHDLDTVARLCPRAIWLDEGRVRASGETEQVIASYVRPSGDDTPAAFRPNPRDTDAYVESASLLGSDDAQTTTLRVGQHGSITVDLVINAPVPALNVAAVVVNHRGVTVLDEALRDATELPDPWPPGRYTVRCPLAPILAVGDYTVTLWIGGSYDDGEHYERAISFTVDGHDDRQRAVRLNEPWSVTRARAAPVTRLTPGFGAASSPAGPDRPSPGPDRPGAC